VAACLQPGALAPGNRLREGGGTLYLLRRGRARVLAPSVGPELLPCAELGPGDAFGLSALLGDDIGRQMEATGPVSVLALDNTTLGGLAARHPSIAGALEGPQPGNRRTVVMPAGGMRLARMTVALPRALPALAIAQDVAPTSDDVRRMTGALKAAGQ
jgi:CRP-like cAMP-binding protein